MKVLVVTDGPLDLSIIQTSDELVHIDLRGNENKDINLMDLYEFEKPELIGPLRERVQSIAPDKIVSIGKLQGYGWNGTVICRCFGQFNSWLGQFENPYGKTILTINGKHVPTFALNEISDWKFVD